MITEPIQTIATRGKFAESVHRTIAALVAPDGTVVFAAGNTGLEVPARSALKPFQAAALHLSGAMEKFRLTDESLALTCASHSGEPQHIEALNRFMQQVGVTGEQLGCGSHWPYHEASREALLRSGGAASQLTNNCSGKHTGFLAAAAGLGADLDGYLEPAHPVQKMIAAQLEVWVGRKGLRTAVDGCSAPTFFLTVEELARLGQLLISGQEILLKAQLRAMQAYPELIAGTGRFDTAFMTTLAHRAVSKEGAEGVQLIGIQDAAGKNWGLALKVMDGASRPREQVALALLESHALLTPQEIAALSTFRQPLLRNHKGLEVGRLSTVLPNA